ncbi:MAG: LPP20 family lipoprotein [Rickettsiales bacterium]|nr:LPP20 family lipoprotein [Rickettsiales bacterium]
MKWTNKKIWQRKIFVYLAIFFAAISCVKNENLSKNSKNSSGQNPSWYINPKQNDSQNLFGVATGANLEEATKSALADAASRLIVSISSQSDSLIEEDRSGVNSQMRQQIQQNIEKIDFTNFKVTRSEKIGAEFFVEVAIERAPFISNQQEKITFAKKQVSDLEQNLSNSNLIQKRVSLSKILDLQKQIELSSRILNGAGVNINLKEELNRLAFFQNKFNQLTDKIEFYFEINSPKEITQIIRAALNKEKIKIASDKNSNNNQITIAIKSSGHSNKIYEAYITKLQIDFQNISGGKIIASNIVEVTGSSTISDKESQAAAIQSLSEKIAQDGILKVIGIIN